MSPAKTFDRAHRYRSGPGGIAAIAGKATTICDVSQSRPAGRLVCPAAAISTPKDADAANSTSWPRSRSPSATGTSGRRWPAPGWVVNNTRTRAIVVAADRARVKAGWRSRGDGVEMGRPGRGSRVLGAVDRWPHPSLWSDESAGPVVHRANRTPSPEPLGEAR